MTSEGINMRSKERTRELGEVFTPSYLVTELLSQISDSSPSTRYFEPGCGSGNFLIQILNRKLDLIRQVIEPLKVENKKNVWMRECFFAAASIYGVDIDSDNVNESRERLLVQIRTEAKSVSADIQYESKFWSSLNRVLEMNIVVGDLINNAQDIEIAEYAELPDNQVKIRYFWFSELIYPDDEVFQEPDKLFDHLPESHRSEPVMDILEVAL
jgi:hypothetical protein